MCVCLCANPNVHALLEGVLLRACRQSLQLCALCPPDPGSAVRSREAENSVEADAEKIARGRWTSDNVWLSHEITNRQYLAASAYEWKRPLDALTNAWSRLLVLVGWRR
jgi:hypothetical protein